MTLLHCCSNSSCCTARLVVQGEARVEAEASTGLWCKLAVLELGTGSGRRSRWRHFLLDIRVDRITAPWFTLSQCLRERSRVAFGACRSSPGWRARSIRVQVCYSVHSKASSWGQSLDACFRCCEYSGRRGGQEKCERELGVAGETIANTDRPNVRTGLCSTAILAQGALHQTWARLLQHFMTAARRGTRLFH